MRTWPSRRLQITVILVLLLGAALRVFMPPLTPHARAQRLYLDSWYMHGGLPSPPGIEDAPSDRAVRNLEEALRLDPGNDLYEQALVWQYEKKDLPELLKTHHFGPGARRLAAGRYAEWSASATAHPSRKYSDRGQAMLDLEAADALSKADPTHSLPHYRKACALSQLGRMDEAYAELKAGNRLGPIRTYVPSVSPEVMSSAKSPLMTPRFEDMARLRRLTMAFTQVANDRLRQGDVQGAREVLEECSQMGVNLSASTPQMYISVLVGIAVQAIAEADLKPLYKDFGMKDRIAQLKRLDAAYDQARQHLRKDIGSNDWLRRMALPSVMPGVLWSAAVIGCMLPVALALLWVLPAIMRRRRGQEKLAVAPWNEGFLARLFLTLYVPYLALGLAIAYWHPDLLTGPEGFQDIGTGSSAAVLSVALINLLVIGLVLRVLHHRYDAHTGERTGMFRFIFKAPANTKAWTRKYLIAAFGAQIAFIAVCGLAATIIYQPVFGGHPWQQDRFRIASFSREQTIVKPLVDDIMAASLVCGHSRNKKQ